MADVARRWSPPQIITSALIAILVWTAFGFSWFGHGFNWVTRRGAEQMSAMAVTKSLASICVAQAREASGAGASIEELTGLSIWKQAEYVEEARWSTMPGGETAPNGVAEMCASMLRDQLTRAGGRSPGETG